LGKYWQKTLEDAFQPHFVGECLMRMQVFWRRRTCLERFLLVLSACLLVAVIVLLSLIASHQHDDVSSQPPPHQQHTTTSHTGLSLSPFSVCTICSFAYNALMLLVGRQEERPACKN